MLKDNTSKSLKKIKIHLKNQNTTAVTLLFINYKLVFVIKFNCNQG